MFAKILVSIVLLLLAMTALMASQLKIFSTDSLEQEAAPCKLTLQIQGKTDVSVFLKSYENQCQTIQKQLPMNKKTETKAELMKEIGNLMAVSWWTVQEGNIDDLWSKDHLGAEYNCAVRYVIDFNTKKSASKSLNIPRDEFIQYLDTTPYHGLKEDFTYGEYLTRYDSKPSLVAVLPQIKTPRDSEFITTETTYAISIMNLHQGSWYSFVLNPQSTVYNNIENYKSTFVVFSTLDYAQNTLNCKTNQAKTY